ncbi:WD40 repeat-like protein [Clavulina sp. PMI_390]|nr:WD40 repeat-like protein [Clavulina sp. PMI_390]
MASRAPTPFSIGRFHIQQINALFFSSDNERLYSGDGDGRVVCTLTRTFRPLAAWQAHTGGILTISEWEEKVITHGRDNKLYVWKAVSLVPMVADTAVGSSSPSSTPSLLYSLDVNSLNFCRFSMTILPPQIKREDQEVFVAVPNLVDSGLTDVWALPSTARIHAAVGKQQAESQAEDLGNTFQPDGILMAIHMYWHDLADKPKPQLRLLAAYEAGHVALFARTDAYLDRSVEGQTWDMLWTCKAHVESVMAMAVSLDQKFALTVSADHLIAKFLLQDELASGEDRMHITRTKYPGNSFVALREDGRVCAVAGWDGKVRLYSTKSFKSLGTLDYHTGSAYAIAFAHPQAAPSASADANDEADAFGDDDGWDAEDHSRRTRWLATGGKEGRVAFWELSSFERS